MKILLVGPIGSGKTTQGQILSQELNIPLIKTGDLLREMAKTDSPEAEQIRHSMQTGTLTPDAIVIKLVKSKINEHPDGFICDSYPRRLSELSVYDPQFDHVIYLNIPDDELKTRLLSRGRADDKPEIIQQRIKVYHQETAPILEHFRNQDILTEVDGVGSIEQVKDRIKKIVGL